MRISDWSSDVCSSDLAANKAAKDGLSDLLIPTEEIFGRYSAYDLINERTGEIYIEAGDEVSSENLEKLDKAGIDHLQLLDRSEEHTSELQSLMRHSYAVFCLQKKTYTTTQNSCNY